MESELVWNIRIRYYSNKSNTSYTIFEISKQKQKFHNIANEKWS